MRNLFILFAILIAPAPAAWAEDLPLEDAIATAQRVQVEVLVAEEQREAAALWIDQARAIWIPSITATGAYTYFNSPANMTFPNMYAPLGPWLDTVQTVNPALPPSSVLTEQPDTVLSTRNQHDVRGSVRVEQTIYSPRALPLRRQALAGTDAASAGVEATREEISRAVISTYFDALRWRRVIEAAERNVALAQVHLERAQRAAELEVGSVFEVNRAEVDHSRATRDLESARTAYALTREALARILDRDPDFDVVPPTPPALDGTVETWTRQALASRDDLRAARLNTTRQEARVDESADRWLPSVQAQLQADIQRETDISGDAFQWYARVAAEWPIYDSGQRRTERQMREREVAEAMLRADDLEAQIGLEVRMAAMRVADQEREVAQTRVEADLARRNETLTREAQAAGVASYLDIRAAQEQRYLAEIAEATAEVALNRALHELVATIGE